jgi:phage tail sheath protein FI
MNYLSPGVYTREIDLSLVPSSQGPLRPAFVGAAKKGPLNKPTLITTPQQYVDVFGEPFPESYLGYSVLAYLEEGNSAYVQRVGVEYQEGMDAGLAIDSIDNSGARKQGWGRIPVFAGIDKGRIFLREVTTANPVVIHAASVTTPAESTTDHVAVVTGTYTGAYDETFTLLITGTASGTDGLEGATYSVTSTTGGVVLSGQLTSGDAGAIDLTDDFGLTLTLSTSGILTEGDYVTFSAVPDNRSVRVVVEGESVTVALTVDGGEELIRYTTSAAFATALDAALNGDASSGGQEVDVVVELNSDGVSVPVIRTTDDGAWLQLAGSEAFCAEVGVSRYAYDIPRSHLVFTDVGPFNLSSANNRVVLDVIGSATTKKLDFVVNGSTSTSVDDLVVLLNANAATGGVSYFTARAFTVPGGTKHVILMASLDAGVNAPYDQLQMKVSWTNLATLRFAQEVGVNSPYTKQYRSYWDARTTLPKVGVDGETPDSNDSLSVNYDATQGALDVDYYAKVVGWFVAKSAGSWADDYSIGIETYTEGTGDIAGRFKVTVYDADGVAVDKIEDVSFNPEDVRFISKVINAGGSIAGINGNEFVEWEHRPSFVDASPDEVRIPTAMRRVFVGGANGIPTDATFSEALDEAIIGNAASGSGFYALSNPESYDFNLLLVPGISSGSVIGQGLQMCESRGDVLFIIDPPAGLRPQQVVEWHNGMLNSDLATAINSSYGALYWSWLKIKDTYNGGSIWVPPSGHVSAVFARTARDTEQWFAPAGGDRGRLLSPADVEYSPSSGERDVLYGSGNAVNPIVKFAQTGITIFGQRTLQRKSTALDRINVRMLMIYIKKQLSVALRAYIFQPNDKSTRAQVRSIIQPFLADIAARRGLTAFAVVCDETNNTPERIDRNELWVSVFIQPTKAAEFISLNLTLMRTGASFSAQEVLAAGGVVVNQ